MPNKKLQYEQDPAGLKELDTLSPHLESVCRNTQLPLSRLDAEENDFLQTVNTRIISSINRSLSNGNLELTRKIHALNMKIAELNTENALLLSRVAFETGQTNCIIDQIGDIIEASFNNFGQELTRFKKNHSKMNTLKYLQTKETPCYNTIKFNKSSDRMHQKDHNLDINGEGQSTLRNPLFHSNQERIEPCASKNGIEGDTNPFILKATEEVERSSKRITSLGSDSDMSISFEPCHRPILQNTVSTNCLLLETIKSLKTKASPSSIERPRRTRKPVQYKPPSLRGKMRRESIKPVDAVGENVLINYTVSLENKRKKKCPSSSLAPTLHSHETERLAHIDEKRAGLMDISNTFQQPK